MASGPNKQFLLTQQSWKLMGPKGESGGKRGAPRRLFSFDSIKSSSTRRSPSESSIVSDPGPLKLVPGPSRLPTLHQVEESNDEGGSVVTNIGAHNWLDKDSDMVESPPGTPPGTNAPFFRPMSPKPETSRPSRRPDSRKPRALTNLSLRPTSPDSQAPTSPSLARWEHLRQHVLPVPPTTPMHSQQPSSASSLASAIPRPQTPKQSRLARLGFRHVVEHAHEVAVDDSRKFSYEIQKACWSARYVESSKGPKADREPPLATMGSALYLPFMSNASLHTTGNLTPINHTQGNNKKPDPRRPQSVQSLALSYHPIPSLKHLYQLLLHHAAPYGDRLRPASNLPHETQVLSTLLGPFLTQEITGARIDEERWFAVEAFGLIVETWNPSNESAGVERCVWCCKAALMPPSPLRTRLIGLLRGLLLGNETFYRVTTPQTLQALVQALFSLLPTLYSQSTTGVAYTETQESSLLNDIISQVRDGCCDELDNNFVEQEYSAIFLANDDPKTVRETLILEAFARCVENCTNVTRRLLLRNPVDAYWSLPSEAVSFTPLLAAIHCRKLSTFSRAAIALLLSESVDLATKRQDAELIVRLLQTRVIPEAQGVHGNTALETMGNVTRIMLTLLHIDDTEELAQWVVSLICRWYHKDAEWKTSFEKTLQQSITDSDWSTVLKTLASLIKMLPDDVRKPVLDFALPIFNDQLVADPPTYPHPPLTDLMDTVSRLYPQVFYKPLFACAASSKEFTVANHLCTITIISKFLEDFWIRDAEMMSVALMSDVGSGNAKADITANPVWGKARLGQSVLLLELIGRIQTERHAKELSSNTDNSFVAAVKFVIALESRLGILLEAKERTVLVPPSQRLLFCVLFREIRLFTRSLKVAPWLPRTVTWIVDSHLDDDVNCGSDMEFTRSISRIQVLYTTAQEGARSSHSRRSTMLLSSSLDSTAKPAAEQTADISAILAEKTRLIASLSKGFVPKALKLMVALSALLTPDDYRRLGSLLWDHHLGGNEPTVTASACFLIMQCAEKTPLELSAMINVDLYSSNDETKLHAIRKIGTLVNWRFQIMSQHVIVDRAHRPFQLARGPLPFVATDIGSSSFVPEEDPNELKDSLPLELRKRLAEIGWAEEDKPVDQQLAWIKTPMSLLPAHQLDRLDAVGYEQIPLSLASPNPSPVPLPRMSPSSAERPEVSGLLRRNSSTGGPMYGTKRRAVFVPSLAAIFPCLARLVFDPNSAVASAARNAVIDLMRNDPALLTRPILDLFTGNQKDMPAAISTVRAFLHVRRGLPPAMAHNVFNNLSGFLKFTARQVETEDTLYDFAHTIPILAKLVTQVSEISIREIRRAKVEIFLIPSGSLWFPSSAPAGPMFPRTLGSVTNPPDSIPARLVSITMVRLSQNRLFLGMLKRNPQDVQLIRKSMSRLVLPSCRAQSDATPLELKDFVPIKLALDESDSVPVHKSLKVLSLMLSRSFLLLVAQVFRSISRHLNDRNELAVLIDGLNRILLVHGDDIGIVSQALIALMVASTRFRRLFTSGGGYTLFMPVLIKIYTESKSHNGIKLAIEYTVNRFYALHREAFVFQSLDVISHLMMVPNIEGDWLAASVYSLFSTLRRGIPPSTPDAAGIHNSNKLQEREALMVSTAEDKPQTFLASLRQGGTYGKNHVTIDLPDEYEASRLGIDNFVRLFLTVIAHDPCILRAEQFLRLFRFLAPHLYHASSSTRSVLREGIDALGTVLTRASAKTKASDAPMMRPLDDSGVDFLSSDSVIANQLLDKSKTSDVMSMRLDYLSLIVAFTRAGGQLSIAASQRVVDLIKVMLRDSTNDFNEPISTFFGEFIRTSLIRETALNVKEVIAFLKVLSPVVSAYAVALDFSDVFETLSRLSANPIFANEPAFSQLVVTEYCAAGLGACELAASEKLLLTLPCRSSIVSLLAQAVSLRGADVLIELEKRRPSYDFLAAVVLPLALTLKTGAEILSDGVRIESWYRTTHARAWIRLLSYAMCACHKSQHAIEVSHLTERSKSQDRRRSTSSNKSQVSSLVMALQIVKTIIIRAENDLSSYLPGVWSTLGSFLQSILIEGNANFALGTREHSACPSPFQSPRVSGQFDQSIPLSLSMDLHSPDYQGLSYLSPRIVDYSLWSLLEMLCLYRSPLMLQMHLFIREKVVPLDQELGFTQETLSPTSTRGRRISSSIFSKPRRRMSGIPSPDTSPRLSASQSFSRDTIMPRPDGRQAGFQNLPLSPSSPNSYGPRIVHLGPISNPSSGFPRSTSPVGLRLMVNSTKISSLSLVRKTYQRIRVVQSCMGYDLLLPIPNREGETEVCTNAWTKIQALDLMVKETKELMEEFEESFTGIEDDMVVVETDQSMSI